MDAASFRRWIGGVVSLTVAACGSAGWPDSSGEWAGPTCADGQWTPLADVTPAAEHDYVALYTGGLDWGASVTDELGTRCAGASNDDCEADMVRWDDSVFEAHLRTTTDGAARTWIGQEVRDFLGSIDSPAEALMVSWSQGDLIACDDLDQTAVRTVSGGWEVVTYSYPSTCAPYEKVRTRRLVTPEGEFSVQAQARLQFERGTCVGRRPQGLEEPRFDRCDVGSWLAAVAHLEAASVVAFERLAVELEHHGAPAELVRGALDAAEDERRHAVVMTGLAARYGAEVPEVVVEAEPVRSLAALALRNATEGCVRECFGALEGAWQAESAQDPVVAAVMGQVASDEAAHGALAWAIAAWVEPLLDAEVRERVEAARQREVVALRRTVSAEPGDVHRQLGVPRGGVGLRLVDAMAGAVWGAGAS